MKSFILASVSIFAALLLSLSQLSAQSAPSKATILSHIGDSWEGTLQGNKGSWYAKITLVGDGTFVVTWAGNRSSTHRGQLGPAGGRAGNPIAVNLKDFSDGSVVRVQWNSIDKLQFEWWPSQAAQAGQRTHKPAHMKGDLTHKPAAVAIGATISFQSINYPEKYIVNQNYVAKLLNVPSPSAAENASFRVVRALNGKSGYVSFESVKYPGYYLRHQGWVLKLAKQEGAQLYKDDASFKPVTGLTGVGYSFESSNYPGYFLRHYQFNMRLDKRNSSELYKKDATYVILSAPVQN